jgi:hypothetical protein
LLSGISKHFVIDEASEVVTAGETGIELAFVLKDPTRKIASYSCVQDMRAGTVGHDVHVEVFGFSLWLFLFMVWARS